MTEVYSFHYVARADAKVLVLGSAPGKISLKENQYYANSRNAFWRIWSELLEFDIASSYADKLNFLKNGNVALWDVLKYCERASSLDADIRTGSEVANDLKNFLQQHELVNTIFFNGAKAEKSFRTHVERSLQCLNRSLDYYRLPSTSPAHAAMSYEQKLEAWRDAFDRRKF